MQNCGELTVKKLSIDLFFEFQEIFEDFRASAIKDYKFESPPLEFKDAEEFIKMEALKGFLLYEDNKPSGFMLYFINEQNAIEVNIIHIYGKDFVNKKRKEILKALVDEVKEQDFWQVISYPLLGIQQSFAREIVQLGFKMTGQTVVKYIFSSVLSDKIRKKFKLPELPENYTITEWKPEYFNQACDVIFESFRKAKDTLFDPRFLSLDGTKDIITQIVSEEFGVFMPDITSCLLYNNKLVGICFANFTNPIIMNIPLVGILDEHKNKGFGKYLVKMTTDKAVEKIKNENLMVMEFNATVETDNFQALRMYRKIGFTEDHSYPHAYLNNPNKQ